MKLLHTSDWHLGALDGDRSLLVDQKFFIDGICDIATERSVDAVIIAGDVYDRSVSSAEAIKLYDYAMTRLCNELKKQVIIVAGNHDSAERLSSCHELLSAAGLHISGSLEREISKVSIGKAVNVAKEQLTLYETRSKELQSIFSDAEKNLAELEASINGASEEYKQALVKFEEAKEKMNRALSTSGFEHFESVKSMLLPEDDRNDLHETIVKYETSLSNAEKELKKKQEELSEKSEPDKTKFEDRQNEISEELGEFNKKTAEIKTNVKRLSTKLVKLTKDKAHFDENIHQAESDLAFAKKLRGDTGIGLQRYVLAIMFNQVIGEANRMLSKVHGGRYHLFRSDDKGAGNKRGLELKVHDNRSPEKEGRSVAMLSGGEKFLVSLALSIGMSTIAQKSGVQIEALFIDEGFGTLDDSSIHDAMDVLDSVRKVSGTIGIISHVQLLEANIPTHLEVIKSERGSTILAI